MNYRILLETYAASVNISEDEFPLLELELDSQIETIKLSRSQACPEEVPTHIYKTAKVCDGSS